MKRTLKESVEIGDKLKEATIREKGEAFYNARLERMRGNPFFQVVKRGLKKLAEAEMTPLDNSDITAYGEVYAAVIEGLSPFLSREIAQVYMTDKPAETFHYSDTPATGDVSASTEQGDASEMTPITVTANRERGLTPKWNRSYLEDCSWAVLEQQVKEAGKAIEIDVMDFVISEYIAGAVAVPFVSSDLGGSLSWAEFCAAVGAHEAADAHPDVLLVHPTTYGELLALDQFVSSLYVGSDEAMRSGIVKTTFGLTIVRSSRMTEGLGLLIEKARAGALVIRADVSIEPFERPEVNKYGFTARIRYGFDTIVPKATYLLSNC